MSGSLTSDGYTGSFSFLVNLTNGNVSNGVMRSGNSDVTPNPLTGGSGSISGSSLNVSGFADGSITGSMSGSASRNTSGLSVSGGYAIRNSDGVQESGSFSGKQR